jgi:AcrR family transcriptional regulator
MAQKSKLPVRDRILETAAELFYRRGINATGIDLIIEKSNIAKASLYHHFPSKEALVATYLINLRKKFEASLNDAVTQRGYDPGIPFDLLEESVIAGEFFGCPFTNALTEMPKSKLIITEVNIYRKNVLDYFSKAVNHDKELSEHLMVIYDGAFTSCKLDPDKRRVKSAKKLALKISQK